MTATEFAALSFPAQCRAALAGECEVKTWWGCRGLSGAQFRHWFLAKLAARINSHDRPTGRKHDPNYQRDLAADARDLRAHIARRVRVYQWRTKEFRARFPHILADRSED